MESTFPHSVSEDFNGSISLPSNLFASIESTAQVGIFFTLYSRASLFPLRPADTARPERGMVASPVVAATVGSNVSVSNITPPVMLQFQLHPETSFKVGQEVSEL